MEIHLLKISSYFLEKYDKNKEFTSFSKHCIELIKDSKRIKKHWIAHYQYSRMVWIARNITESDLGYKYMKKNLQNYYF